MQGRIKGASMRIAVAGATGNIGSCTGAGLDEAPTGVAAVLAARGRTVTLVPTWSSVFGLEMAGNALLTGPDARLASTTSDQWLSQQR